MFLWFIVPDKLHLTNRVIVLYPLAVLSHVQPRFTSNPTLIIHTRYHASSKITGMHKAKAGGSPPRRLVMVGRSWFRIIPTIFFFCVCVRIVFFFSRYDKVAFMCSLWVEGRSFESLHNSMQSILFFGVYQVLFLKVMMHIRG